jgi:hypothetical protein
MQYSETQLNKLIDDVEKEFTAHLAKTEQEFNLAKSESASAPAVDGIETLAKAEEEKPAKEKEEKKEDAPKSEEKPAAEAKEGEKPADAPAQEEKEAAPAAEGKEAAAPPAGDGAHGYDAEDLEHMIKMYSSMSRAELMAHHDAVKQCLDASAPAPTEEVVAAPAEAATEAPSGDMPMAKSESALTEFDLLKSEFVAKEAKIAELQKNLDVATEFLTKLFSKKSAPAGKAITTLDAINKSENVEEVKSLSETEITTLLSKKAADPSLAKSDRDAINNYYLGSKNLEKISHLLK